MKKLALIVLAWSGLVVTTPTNAENKKSELTVKQEEAEPQAAHHSPLINTNTAASRQSEDQDNPHRDLKTFRFGDAEEKKTKH